MNVFVVSTYTEGTGGFDWFWTEQDARTFLETESGHTDQETHWVGAVQPPAHFGLIEATDSRAGLADAITDGLNSNPDLWERAS